MSSVMIYGPSSQTRPTQKGNKLSPLLFPKKGPDPPLLALFRVNGSAPQRALRPAQLFDLAPEIEALVVHKVPPVSQTSTNRRSSCNGERLEALPGQGSEGSIPARGRASYVVRAVA